MAGLQRETFRYTAFFCEENVWWLVKDLFARGVEQEAARVLLFTNVQRSIVAMNQRAAVPGGPLIWDYHVVLQASLGEQDWIFDFDSRLPFPTPSSDYLNATFPAQDKLPALYRTEVRVIPAAAYLAHFFSDRSHMLGILAEADFPDYPIIRPGAGVSAISLAEYRDLDAVLDDGSAVRPVHKLMA